MNMKSLSTEKLLKLRDQIDIALRAKVADERSALQAKLDKLSRLSTSRSSSSGLGGAHAAGCPRNTAIRKIRAKPWPAAD